MKTKYIKRILYFILVQAGIPFLCLGQTTEYDINFNLSTDPGNVTKEYVGRDYIRLTPGFHYKAENGKTFRARIDEHLLFENTDVNDFPVISRSLDFSKAVGAIPGQPLVTATGAAIYTIPLEIPPGTNNMIPDVSISYNSQAGNGLLGWGWNIGGLSAITRIQQTIYHDKNIKPINLSSDDRFALNGSNLIVTNGTYGSSGSTYHTEVESFSKITYEQTPFPHFIVESTNGLTYEYGNTTESRFEAQNSSQIIMWFLNKIYDKNGNFITYKYHIDKTNGECYPESIEYTGNSSTTPYNAINFYYEIRADKEKKYIANSEIKSNVILNKIKITSENMLVSEYHFLYHKTTTDLYSRLIEIEKKGADGSKFNTTIIQWGNDESSISYVNSVPPNNQNYYFIMGDYNGDGKTDFVRIPYVTSPTYWELFINTDGQNFQYTNTGSLPANFIRGIGINTSYLFGNYFKSFDINHDGKDDMLITRGDGMSFLRNIPYFSTGTGFTPSTSEFPDHTSLWLRPGDFDGDGTIEFLSYNPVSGYFDISNYYWSEPSDVTSSGTLWPATSLYTGDFNGDGKTEIMIIKNSECRIYTLDRISGLMHKYYFGGYPTNYHQVYTGDFNGDGKTDLLTYSTDHIWRIGYSTGTGFLEELAPITTQVDPDDDTDDYNYFVADFNGDGKDDILEAIAGVSTSSQRIYYSYGNGFIKETNVFDYPGVNEGYYNFGDFNGDGKIDIFYHHNMYSDIKLIFFHKDEKKYLATAIENGFNQTVHFKFEPLTKSSVYTKWTNASGEISDFLRPLYVVSDLAIANENGVYHSSSNYKYEGAKIHRWGKGFLGFSKIFRTDNTGITVEDNYEILKTNDYCTGTLLKTNITKFGGNSISEITNTNTVYQYQPESKLIFIKTEHITENHFEKGLTNIYRTNNNSTGNLTDEDIIYADGNSISTDYRNFITIGTSGNYSKPQQIITEKTIDGNSFSNTLDFTWNGLGLLENTTENNITTAFSYDDFGNITHKEISGTQRKEDYFYDSKGRFPIRYVDALGYETKRDYDPRFGTVTKLTDFNLLTSTYLYDGFGRLKQKVLPDGQQVVYNLLWYSGGTFATALYSSFTQSTGVPFTKTYFDGLGREVGSETQGFHGNVISSEIHYNIRGLVDLKTKPHYGNSGDQHTFLYLDSYGRLSKEIMPTATLNYSYIGRVATVTSPLGTNSTQVNCLGMKTNATDNGNSVSYKYGGHGGISQISSQSMDNFSTTSTYYSGGTSNGLQYQLNDPDAGTTTYTYNSFRELETQVDGTGNLTTLTYDNLGRVKTKSVGGILTTYTYDTEFKGALTSMVSDNTSVFYKYNSYGDVIKKTEHFQGQTDFITNYEYDSKHRLIRKVYPSNFAIKYIYDNFGYLEVITKNNGQPVWRVLSYNASMQVESYESGDNIETINTYNNNYLATTTSTKMGYQNPFHNMEFTWDFTTGGNLSMRKDYVTDNLEMFGYEAQRCTSGYVMDEGPQFSVTYENSGNIHTKSDAGTYIYEGTPHAVTKISDFTGNFPSAVQGITYNELNKAATLDEDGYHMEISYGVIGERFKEELKLNNNPQWIKYYSEDYEKIDFADGSTKEYHYISAPSGLVAVNVNDGNTNPLYYTFSDHLGSITTLTDESGNVVERMSFDAWGRRRNPIDWSYNNLQAPATLILSRGYTSHEHLDAFNLINMNSRMYDPVLGRFLSPDNFILGIGSQAYNRYTYCLNNPLKYTDPTGNYLFGDPSNTGDWWHNLFDDHDDKKKSTVTWDKLAQTQGYDNAKQMLTTMYTSEVIWIAASMSGLYVASFIPVSGFWSALAYGAVNGGVRGIIAGTAGSLFMGGDLKTSLINGLKLGYKEGINDALIYSTAYGSPNVLTDITLLNLRENDDVFEGDGIKLNFGPVTWDSDMEKGYRVNSIFNFRNNSAETNREFILNSLPIFYHGLDFLAFQANHSEKLSFMKQIKAERYNYNYRKSQSWKFFYNPGSKNIADSYMHFLLFGY